MAPPKENNNFPGNDSKLMEICDLSNKEFKMVVLRKLNEVQENTQSQINEIRKTIQEKNEKFNREIKIIKKKQIRLPWWHNG